MCWVLFMLERQHQTIVTGGSVDSPSYPRPTLMVLFILNSITTVGFRTAYSTHRTWIPQPVTTVTTWASGPMSRIKPPPFLNPPPCFLASWSDGRVRYPEEDAEINPPHHVFLSMVFFIERQGHLALPFVCDLLIIVCSLRLIIEIQFY